MLRGLTFRTRAKMATVAAVLGLLVWADARGQDDCQPEASRSGGQVADRPAGGTDNGVACAR